MEGDELLSFLFGGGGNKLRVVLQHFRTCCSIPAYYNNFRYQKLSQRQHVLLL